MRRKRAPDSTVAISTGGQGATDDIAIESLSTIAKGAGAVLGGTLIGMILMFAARVILARYLTQSDYGILSLSLVIFGLCLPVSMLGLQEGATRYIGYFRGRDEPGKVSAVIASSLALTSGSSILVAIGLFLAAGVISDKVYRMAGLATPLRLLALAVPLYAGVNMLVAVFRGFDIVRARVYFVNLLQGGLLVILLIGVASLRLSLRGAVSAYVASSLLALLALAVYSTRRLPVGVGARDVDGAVTGRVLMFSIPVFAVTLVNVVQTQMNPLILGLFENAEVLGLYGAAWPLAQYLSLTLTAMAFIYVPIISRLHAKGSAREIEVSYQLSTKWLFLVSFPLFLVLLSYARPLLGALFGSGYADAAIALQILSVGFLVHTSLGANGLTLLAIGKSRALLGGSLAGAMLSLVCNIILVPRFGLEGAAVAAVLSFLGVNLVNSAALYHFSRIHPFTSDYVKALLVTAVSLAAYGVVASSLPRGPWTSWIVPPFLGLAWLLCLILTNSVGSDDFALVSNVVKDAAVAAVRIAQMVRRVF